MKQISRKWKSFSGNPFELNGEKIDFPAVICGIMDGGKMKHEDVILSYIEYLASTDKKYR